MYKLSLHLFRIFWPTILLMSIVLFLLDIWGQERWSTTLVPKVMAYGFLVFFFHRYLLTGQKVELTGVHSRGQIPNWRFWFAYAFPFVAAIASFFSFLKLVNSTFPTEALIGQAPIAYAFILSIVFLGILLSIVGTMIPAATVGTSTGFKAASRRARRTFWFVFWRLVVGPALYSMVLMNVLVQLGELVTLPQFPQGFSSVTATNAIVHITMTFFGIFNSALTASIFSMAYVFAEEGLKLNLPREAQAHAGEIPKD